jgi:hypothetical protein
MKNKVESNIFSAHSFSSKSNILKSKGVKTTFSSCIHNLEQKIQILKFIFFKFFWNLFSLKYKLVDRKNINI